MKKRVLAWLLTLALLLTLLPSGVMAQASSVEGPVGYGRSILARMDNAKALLYVYDTIEEKLDTTAASIAVGHTTHKVTWEELCTVYDLVLSDHPEVFWHGATYSGSLSSDGYALALKPAYVMTGADLDAARARLEAEVVRLTADLEGKSDYQKSLILHNRVAAKSEYVSQGLHQTAYGALVQGTAVCAGYAHAYELLMKRVGIPTWYVTGTSISPSGTVVPHAWNLVQLDGDWYYTDVTWDDQKSYTFYANLNVTTDQITEDHTFGAYAEYLPTCTATADNYFVIHDLQRETYDIDTVVHILRDFSVARVYITGNKKAFLNEVSAHLWDVMEALHAPPGAVSYKYSSLGHEVILEVHSEHTCQYVPHLEEATCGTDGYMAEICSYEFCHNERNRTVIPATGLHDYDNECDDTCNVCGAHRWVTDHVYDSVCDPDCNICGAARETEGHVYDNACDPDCNTCGAERETQGHVYKYPCSTRCCACGALRPDEAMHEHKETVITPATCGQEGLSRFTCIYCGDSFTMITPMTLQHVYDHACDNECNVCFMMRAVEGHAYDDVYDATCNYCGEIREVACPHAYKDPANPVCVLCGKAPALSDKLTVYSAADNAQLTRGDEFTVSVLMKNNPGLIAWRIYVAFDQAVLELVSQTRGDVFPAGKVTFGPLKSPTNAMFTDAINPDVEGDGVLFTLTFRVLEDAPFGTSLLDVYLADPMDFYNQAWDEFEIDTLDTAVVVTDHVHTYDGICDGECNVCGFTRPAAEHAYDNACDAVCNGCGLVREVKPHAYTVKVVDPTCEGEGTKTSVCSICGHTVNETIPALGHDYTVTVFAPDCVNDGYTLHACNRCRYSYTDEIVPALGHKPGAAADCVNPQLCTVCGIQLNPALGHSYDNACDAACNACGETREVPDHVYDHEYDATCNECGDVREIPFIPGDVDDNGTVNVRDYGRFQQYLNGFEVAINLAAANVDGNSSVNVRDLGRLQQYLNGWDVQLGA